MHIKNSILVNYKLACTIVMTIMQSMAISPNFIQGMEPTPFLNAPHLKNL